jgi:hypothetical protein
LELSALKDKYARFEELLEQLEQFGNKVTRVGSYVMIIGAKYADDKEEQLLWEFESLAHAVYQVVATEDENVLIKVIGVE